MPDSTFDCISDPDKRWTLEEDGRSICWLLSGTWVLKVRGQTNEGYEAEEFLSKCRVVIPFDRLD